MADGNVDPILCRRDHSDLAKWDSTEGTSAHDAQRANDLDNGSSPLSGHVVDLADVQVRFNFWRVSHSHGRAARRSAAFRPATLCHGRLVRVAQRALRVRNRNHWGIYD